MNRRELLSLAAAVGAGTLLPGCGSTVPSAAPGSSTPSPVAPYEIQPGLPGFGGRLFDALAPDHSNVLFSPWSIAMVLSMVREGAVGETATELDTLLGGAAPGFGDSLAAEARAMQSASGTLHVANSLWGQDRLGWKEPFLARLERTYGAPLRQVDFTTGAESARQDINQWVARQTKGKIPALIDPGLIDAMTRLVLVNALHFKAPWLAPMRELGRRPFSAATGHKVMIPTLAGGGSWSWWESTDCSATAIPCDGGDFALVVALPKDPTSRGSVDPSTYGKVLKAAPVPVALQMPAWKFRLKVMLTGVLKQLGLTLAFDAHRADFSGMTAQERLALGFVVHEAMIDVNAKGIEAAAATAGGMVATGALVDPRELVISGPFSYALMHVATATPLFLGRVGDPSVESAG